MSDDPLAYLCAALDAAEQVARQAAMAIGRTGYEGGVLVDPPARWGDDLVADGQHWVSSYATVKRKRQAGEKSRTVAECGGFGARSVAEHAALHDPAAVLRRIKADRKTLSDYELTARIRDEAAQRIRDAGDRPDSADLDTWDRAQREAAILVDVVHNMAQGWGWTGEEGSQHG